MHPKLLLLGLLLQSPVPVQEEPRHRTRLENGLVRVLDVLVPPGDATLLHTHSRDLVVITLSNALTWSASEIGERRESTSSAGRVTSTVDYAERPRAHRVGNRGKTPYHLVAIEILGPPGFEPGSEKGPLITGDRSRFHEELEDENVIVYRLKLEPGESTGPHAHPRPSILIRFPDGDIQWVEEGSEHALDNPAEAGGPETAFVVVLK